MSASAHFLEAAAAILDKKYLLTDPKETAPYAIDWRRRYRGAPVAVAEPATTAEVSALMALCRTHRVPVVPQGGNTGLVGGATPDDSGRQLVLSTRRLNRVRSVDTDNNTITVEAGMRLAEIQQIAHDAGRLFPLSLASEGSCQIGGNLSTNAGGLAVLRYGNMREITLGLEVVLPDGRILDVLHGLRKNNSGYDLKHWFIGAEGTLGIITAATLRLFPLPTAQATACIEVSSPLEAVRLLRDLEDAFGDRLTAFELISGTCMALVAQHFPDLLIPFHAPWLVLLELSDGGADEVLQHALLDWLEKNPPQGEAVLAKQGRERTGLWAVREAISEAQTREGPSIKHDIALPVSSLPAFIETANNALRAEFHRCRVVVFGHLGDGNLHYNVSRTRGEENPLLDEARVNEIVYDTALAFGGTLSAEHGIGQLRRHWLEHYRDPLSMELMRGLKRMLDPDHLMNPGKLL